MTDLNNFTEVEEGVIADTPKTTSHTKNEMHHTNERLSLVSRQYDINGDGVLDEAELASRLCCFVSMYDSCFVLCLTRHFTLVLTKQCAISTRADADS